MGIEFYGYLSAVLFGVLVSLAVAASLSFRYLLEEVKIWETLSKSRKERIEHQDKEITASRILIEELENHLRKKREETLRTIDAMQHMAQETELQEETRKNHLLNLENKIQEQELTIGSLSATIKELESKLVPNHENVNSLIRLWEQDIARRADELCDQLESGMQENYEMPPKL